MEILAVLVILGTVLVLVVPNITNSSAKTKNRLYETKVTMIENSAVLYGEDNYGTIIKSGNKDNTNTYYVKTITVKELVSNQYFDADTNDGSVEDPRSNGKTLDNCQITIKINNSTKKVTADFDENTCS